MHWTLNGVSDLYTERIFNTLRKDLNRMESDLNQEREIIQRD
jgi:hypothetical protein